MAWHQCRMLMTAAYTASYEEECSMPGTVLAAQIQQYFVTAVKCEGCHTPQLVSWSLTSPFSTNMAISETKGQGWRAILPSEKRLATYQPQPWPPFCSADTQKGKGIERLI